HLVAGQLVPGGGLLGQGVDAAVHVGVVPLVVLPQHLQHLPRLLRGGRAVQVHQRLVAVHHAVQDGEVLADRLPVVPRAHGTSPVPEAAGTPACSKTEACSATPVYFAYPWSSSRSASSGPPSSTIRPPAKTCTKSGVM